MRDALFAILLGELVEERADALEALFEEFMPKVSKAVEESAVDAYVSVTFLANMAMADLSRNRLVGDLLNSITLRTLRYVRLGLASNPGSLENSIKTWRALQRAVAKRDIDAVLQTARKRIESSRDAAIRALSAGTPKGKGAASRPQRRVVKAA
ncbi:FCD domain protein [compost metagenome]